MLEEWAAAARAGDIVGVGIAMVKADGMVSNVWTATGCGLLLVASASVLQHQIIAGME
jgi:hypothetical protein